MQRESWPTACLARKGNLLQGEPWDRVSQASSHPRNQLLAESSECNPPGQTLPQDFFPSFCAQKYWNGQWGALALSLRYRRSAECIFIIFKENQDGNFVWFFMPYHTVLVTAPFAWPVQLFLFLSPPLQEWKRAADARQDQESETTS